MLQKELRYLLTCAEICAVSRLQLRVIVEVRPDDDPFYIQKHRRLVIVRPRPHIPLVVAAPLLNLLVKHLHRLLSPPVQSWFMSRYRPHNILCTVSLESEACHHPDCPRSGSTDDPTSCTRMDRSHSILRVTRSYLNRR